MIRSRGGLFRLFLNIQGLRDYVAGRPDGENVNYGYFNIDMYPWPK